MAKKISKSVKKHKCMMSALYMVGGILFLLGGARFYFIGDCVGATIYGIAGILALIVAAGLYYRIE